MDLFRVDVSLIREGVVALDSETALLLKYIEETGSISAAARRLGIPYSRAWGYIARAERALGIRLVEPRRGYAGGARLTDEGRRLLARYLEFVSRRLGGLEALTEGMCDFVYAGSSDLFVKDLLERLREEGFCVEARWVGSATGLIMAAAGLADVAGVHLLDPASGEYNVPYVERLGLSQSVVLHRGFMRSIGFAFRPDVEFRGVEDLLKYRVIARNPGSGTRLLLELLVDKLAERVGKPRKAVADAISGYNTSARTHEEVVGAIARGEADVGLAIAAAAEKYGLAYRHVALERFDLAVNRYSLEKPAVRRLLELLRKEQPPPGYTPVRSAGQKVLV
ncbi:transcriptional regulator of molybdate metabolism, LysR family [Thermoproteus uzoniensis 768-20]|uniref:Transcriptional regulator of molybdate metabolism, LysR family n=1 Tax=Thermoproteus uzoniensis (strain 768-20) TaxID=999630 RepID=F2L2U4_THEU7|nr:substrate-binding domain-containing protein [Thermoproteus uzoniensis]AEA11882.1 transcriptional regulator of molybdate metabolism, LysR family [Thermoproteus uzoniensis 768-20]